MATCFCPACQEMSRILSEVPDLGIVATCSACLGWGTCSACKEEGGPCGICRDSGICLACAGLGLEYH